MLSRAVNFIRLHRRWQVVALLFLFSVVNNLNRHTLSVLGPTMERVLHFGPKEYSYVVTSFLAAYALGYVFCGAVIDRFGVKITLTCALVFWSFAGAMHAFAAGWFTLAFYRFLLGLAESFTSPAGMKALAEWVPARERGLSAAIFSNGNTVGAILAPPVVSILAIHVSWRAGFMVPAVAGLILLFFWQRGYSAPMQDRRLTQVERQLIVKSCPVAVSKGPRRSSWKLLMHPVCAGFFVIRFLTDPVTYFFAFWIPEYLSHSRGFSLALIGMVAWIPFFASDIGGPGGGALSDLLIRRGASPISARRRVMLGAALAMPLAGAVVLAPQAWMAIALLALASAAQSCWMANQLALISESVTAADVGKVLALSALGGSLGGMISTMLAGNVIAIYGYRPVFITIGFLHLAGWSVLRISQRIHRSHQKMEQPA